MQSLKEKILEEFDRLTPKDETNSNPFLEVLRLEFRKFLSDSIDIVENHFKYDINHCECIGCYGEAKFCQEHKDLY